MNNRVRGTTRPKLISAMYHAAVALRLKEKAAVHTQLVIRDDSYHFPHAYGRILPPTKAPFRRDGRFGPHVGGGLVLAAGAGPSLPLYLYFSLCPPSLSPSLLLDIRARYILPPPCKNIAGEPWEPASESFRGEAMGPAQVGQPGTAAGHRLRLRLRPRDWVRAMALSYR